MKRIMIIVLLIGSISIFADIYPSCIFTSINPSATGMSLGRCCGGADIWNKNPLDVWSNPAMLGYYEGLSLGYSHDSYLEEAIEDLYFDSSYLVIGWKGIGIMVPMLNNQSKFGTRFDYGIQNVYEEDANCVKLVNPWESSAELAVGLNLLEFYGAFSDDEGISKLQAYTDLSLGYNYNIITTNNIEYGPSENDNGTFIRESYLDGLGMILRFSPLNERNYSSNYYLKTDFVISLYSRNYSRTSIRSSNSYNPIAFSKDSAASFKLGVGIENLKSTFGTEFYNISTVFCEDIISLKLYTGKSHMDDNCMVYGNGLEFSLFDIVSLRVGDYNDEQGHVEGRTTGLGLNLRYHDLVQLQYNYAEYPGGEIQEVQKVSDFMLNVNLGMIFKK